MTAFALFTASFAVVFWLGVQQLNVNTNRRGLAFATSILISAATLIQFKVLPGPTSWLDMVAYVLGSAFGIVASMAAYPHLVRVLRFRSKRADMPLTPQPPDANAVRLGETLRLATQIAEYSSRSDIETLCPPVDKEAVRWWDTTGIDDDELTRCYVHNACAYLHLRGGLIRHPMVPHLVRFSR